jgi:beta-lactamase family protein
VPILAPAPAPPVILTPRPREVSFGRIVGRVSAETETIVISVDGRVVGRRDLGGKRFNFALQLPARDVRLSIRAVGPRGHGSSTTVGPVFGLPLRAEPRGPPRRNSEDARLGRTIRSLGRAFPGSCGIYVQDLRSGAGAAWNAGAEFPAASTIKVALAIEVLRVLGRVPHAGDRLDRLLRKAIIPSDDKAANELLI